MKPIAYFVMLTVLSHAGFVGSRKLSGQVEGGATEKRGVVTQWGGMNL